MKNRQRIWMMDLILDGLFLERGFSATCTCSFTKNHHRICANACARYSNTTRTKNSRRIKYSTNTQARSKVSNRSLFHFVHTTTSPPIPQSRPSHLPNHPSKNLCRVVRPPCPERQVSFPKPREPICLNITLRGLEMTANLLDQGIVVAAANQIPGAGASLLGGSAQPECRQHVRGRMIGFWRRGGCTEGSGWVRRKGDGWVRAIEMCDGAWLRGKVQMYKSVAIANVVQGLPVFQGLFAFQVGVDVHSALWTCTTPFFARSAVETWWKARM